MEEEVKEQDVSESKEEEEMKQDEETSNSENLPEVSKSTCQHCNKEFSSVWVLKAHCEEVHKDLVPLDFLEKYAHQIKCEYEKKVVPTTTTPPSTTTTSSVMNTPSTISSSAVTSSSPDITPEKEHDDNKEELHAKLSARESQHSSQHENPNPPSTPTAPSTPASSTDSIPPNVSSSTPSNQSGPMPMNLAQQMNEMQAALNAMAASQLQQQLQQFNPMMMGMAGLGMGLPLGLNMPALAAMNLQPPLVPMMMPPPPFEPMVGGQNPLFSPQSDHSSMMSKQQQQFLQQHQQQQAAQATANASQQKRARTRITDDQLKILRAHFDINNSPSEEQIHEMAAQSGLPPKVIKHWFRNTLFKERQRNKDSPYNFNNPPSTTLNLEEYEKTGEAKVMPLPSADNLTNDDVVSASTITVKKSADAGKDQPSSGSSSNSTLSLQMKKKQQQAQQAQQISEAQNFLTQAFQQAIKKEPSEIKTEPEDDFHRAMESHHHKMNPLNLESLEKHSNENQSGFEQKSPLNFQQTFRQDCHRDTVASPPLSPSMNDRLSMNTSGSRSSPENLTLTSIIASQLGPNANTTSHSNLTTMTVSTANNMLPPKITPPNFTSPSQLQQSPTSVSIPPATRSLSPARSLSSSSDCFNPSLLSGVGGNSNGSNSSSGSTGKRANRTRFTDYQIKVLQEFFENNAYPKDDDLEYLSKLLSLSPRVIVVWFQNARQKARKVYENQPPVELSPGLDETGAGRFQRTPGLNYQCKKCLLVFQRYYELIRHQKTHCFKEEDAKRSAQAQAAAAQIAAVLSSEDSNSSTVEQNQQALQLRETATSSNPPTPAAPTTPTPSLSMYPPSPAPPSTPTPENKDTSFQCDNCNLVFPRFELWREHQLVHIMNPNLFPSYPPDSPFGILQQHAQMQQQQQQQQQEQQQQQQQQREQQQQHQQQQQREQHQSQSAPSQQSVVPSDLSTNSSPPSPHPFLSMLNATKRKFEEYDFMCDRDGEQPKDKRLRTTILPEQLDYLYQKYQVESNPSRKMLENIAREVGLKKRVVQVWFQNTRARERKGQFRAHSQVINKRCPFCPALFKVKSALESHLTTKHPEQCGRGEINIDSLPDEELSMESAQSFQTAQANEMRDKFEGTQNMAQPMFQGGADIENFKKYYEESMKRYISELQTHQQLQNGGPMPENLRKGEGETTTTHGESPLDLSKPVDLSRQIRMHFDERNAEMNDMSDDDSMSEATDFMDGDESNPTSPASSTQSNQMNKSGSMSNSKRYRTQMTSLQVKVMKSLFGDYKTPTMSECEMLGREIGLPKRVIQVWFQNARAKDKKYKLSSHKGGDDADENPKTAEDCKFCQFKYSHKYSVQDHIFTKKHIDMVKAYLEARLSQKELNSGHVSDGEFTVPPAPDVAAINHNNNSTSPNQQQLAQLQILQMSQAMALAAAKDPSSLTPEDVALLHQLYGLGLPQGLPLHPALISAAVQSDDVLVT